MDNIKNHLFIFMVISLVVGVVLGYFYGNKKGRTDLLVEQKITAQKAVEEVQKQIVESANPFGTAQTNPFEGGYQNPFKQVNPFSK